MIQKVLFQENLKLILKIVHLFSISAVVRQLIRHFLDPVYCNNRYRHQGTVATRNGSTSPFKVSEAFLCDLDPPCHKIWVNASFILCNLALKKYLVVWVLQIDLVIGW